MTTSKDGESSIMMNHDQLMREMTRFLNQYEQQQPGTPKRVRVMNIFLTPERLDEQSILLSGIEGQQQEADQFPGEEERRSPSWTFEEETPFSSLPEEEEEREHATPSQHKDDDATWLEEEEQIQAHFLDAEQEEGEEAETGDLTARSSSGHQRAWRLMPPSGRVLIVALLCLIALLLGMAYAFFTWLPSATVTIIPVSQTITITKTLAIATNGSNSGTPGTTTTIPGRLLPTLAARQQQTVPTTGQGHTDAQAAQGLITFYNSALVAQTVPAGTLLTGADGVQVTTDTDATIPTGSLSVNGQVTVSAHAVVVGPQGNISAGDIYGPCCRQNIMAANTAFHGGTVARDFRTVSKQDVDQTTRSLTTTLQKSMQVAEENQVQTGESLITPLLCTTTSSSDQPVGTEAQQVSVTVHENCTGVVYTTSAMQQVMRQASSSEASKTLGRGYQMEHAPQVTVTVPAQRQDQQQSGQVTVQVKSVGTWAYQFSSAQLDQMRTAITGMDTETASKWLLHIPGVQQVMFSTNNGAEVLPQDASRIHLNVLSPSW